MVWQAANLCQQTSHKSHVNKRQFSAKWHPWWGYCYNQRGWKGITGWLTNSCSFIWFWNLIKVAIVTTHPVMAAADDQTKSFLFSHRYVCHWSYYCTQNLSFYFGEMSLKPAPVRLVFKRVQRSKGSATIHKAYHRSWVSLFFFTTKSTLNPNSIQICTGNSVKLYEIVR